MGYSAEHLSEPRQKIIQVIKSSGASTMSELASIMNISTEAARQHLLQLEKEGWISRFTLKNTGMGRPQLHYRLTAAGEHLFEKNYDHLTIEVLDTLAHKIGGTALESVLSAMVEERIREWEPKLAGLSTLERLNVLKNFYIKDDEFMEVVQKDDAFYLIERNCPFHNVALKRPILCSVTVSVLTNLLGCAVKREQRFQNGDGCCSFLVQIDQPVDSETTCFIIEEEPFK